MICCCVHRQAPEDRRMFLHTSIGVRGQVSILWSHAYRGVGALLNTVIGSCKNYAGDRVDRCNEPLRVRFGPGNPQYQTVENRSSIHSIPVRRRVSFSFCRISSERLSNPRLSRSTRKNRTIAQWISEQYLNQTSPLRRPA
jgi:hypothetical protein